MTKKLKYLKNGVFCFLNKIKQKNNIKYRKSDHFFDMAQKQSEIKRNTSSFVWN